MSPHTDNADNLNPVLYVDAQRPTADSAALSPDQQSAPAPDSTTNKIEKLLDIDGLLEMAKILNGIRRDGRLEGADEDLSDHIDELQM